MNACETEPSTHRFTHEPSAQARARMLSRWGEPLFLAAWKRVLMIHLEVDPASLQRAVPFPLDLYEGRAYVTLVSFTLENMRPRWGGRLAARLFQPIATHDFLNVRTYVKCGDEPGIHFLAEWLSNRLAVRLGPPIFGLPYHYGKIDYRLEPDQPILQGRVTDEKTGTQLEYAGVKSDSLRLPCQSVALSAWLMERYTAFNAATGRKKFFRVWHPPWPQCEAEIKLKDISLLTRHWPLFADAKLVGANYSPGFDEVWMGRPHAVRPPF
ncbi:MAG TPA: DUF2071 domain-containing protein [Candidatus Sulfotelmatobacter sp.]|jgi:uncharacterized protein YqjF (DUF2071 family)|nr:DUF2071 domain-containing protein [Candidatus Sulfotelmatobacter sp.]